MSGYTTVHPTYLWWNDRLAAHFFNPTQAGQPVYLYVTESLLAELGAPSRKRDFLAAMRAGPPWAIRQGLCQKAYQSFTDWRARRRTYPPYIGYLGLFVLAAGVEGDFAPNAYYPRLREIIGESPGGMLPSFGLMLELWDDLERWSNQDKLGEWGIFVPHVAGSWIHVGFPISQTLLSEHERNTLPLTFANAGLDPTSQPPDLQLARSLRAYGADHLRHRTVALLNYPRDEAGLFDALIETVRQELSRWDGTVDLETASPDQQVHKTYGNLRLCMALNRVQRRVGLTLRCRLNRVFPEDALLLYAKRGAKVLSCEEDVPGWSTALTSSETGVEIDASQYDWEHGFELENQRLGWHFKLSGSPVRVFTNGVNEGLSGFTEAHHLTRSVSSYIAAKEECCALLQRWGNSCCKDYMDVGIMSGLPAGWRLFRSSGASCDEHVREIYPVLSFSRFVHLSLVRGIRSSQGNTFFDFAAPDVELDGGDGSERVYCDGRELERVAGTVSFALPTGLSTDTKLSIEVRQGTSVVRQLAFYLLHGFDWRLSQPSAKFDRFGKRMDHALSEIPSAAGAYLTGALSPGYRFVPPMAPFKGQQVFLVGPAPGQIISWPKEAIPDDWLPVWAIPMRGKHGKAVFCGTSTDLTVFPEAAISDPAKLDLWKEVLWYGRKRIAPPPQTSLSKLWKRFQEAAGRVR